MAVFFFLVGLEIKREVLEGQLSSPAKAALPAVAAVGGMVAPALIYVAFNAGDPTAINGWAIPAATDIAFALGLLALVGSGVPVALKIFLLALAILDDLGAIIIIAAFYIENLSIQALILAGVGFTMSLFIGTLAFADASNATYVRIGVLSGSTVSGIMGIILLKMALARMKAEANMKASNAT